MSDKKDFRLNRLFSEPLSALLLKTPIRPNQVTFLSLACGVTAGILFSFGRYGLTVVGACFYQLACILDNCDGEIARAKKLGSEFGAWLDIFADFLTDTSLFLGLAAGAISQYPASQVLLAAGLCLFGGSMHLTLVVLEKKRGFGPAAFGAPNPGRKGWYVVFFDALREGDISWLVLLFALAGYAYTLVFFGAFYMQALWMVALVVNFKHLIKAPVK